MTEKEKRTPGRKAGALDDRARERGERVREESKSAGIRGKQRKDKRIDKSVVQGPSGKLAQKARRLLWHWRTDTGVYVHQETSDGEQVSRALADKRKKKGLPMERRANDKEILCVLPLSTTYSPTHGRQALLSSSLFFLLLSSNVLGPNHRLAD